MPFDRLDPPRVHSHRIVGGDSSHLHSQTHIRLSNLVGLLDALGQSRLKIVLKKVMKGGFLPKTHPAFAQLCDSADERMFGEILRNPGHTMQHLLPPINQAKSKLRTRAHDRAMLSIAFLS